MHIRKLAGFLAVLVLAFGMLTSTALACHGRHRGTYAASYSLCQTEGCELAGRHVHDGVTYCGYEHSSGYCDGTCVALCAVEGCQTAGRHVHDGVTYCGSAHDCGYCDGTCTALYTVEGSQTAGHHGHGGAHHGGHW